MHIHMDPSSPLMDPRSLKILGLFLKVKQWTFKSLAEILWDEFLKQPCPTEFSEMMERSLSVLIW